MPEAILGEQGECMKGHENPSFKWWSGKKAAGTESVIGEPGVIGV